jgi:FkbM family methyltransferase
MVQKSIISSLRNTIKRNLPRRVKKSIERLILGYDNFVPSFSSAGEDMILRHLVGCDKRDGFYVDVGAFHPKNGSNTYFFYLNGWRGINIDARPGSMDLFRRVRPRDINLELAISNETSELTYYVLGSDSPMNSFSREFLSGINMLKNVQRQIKMTTSTLTDIFTKYLPTHQPIDFLNVDVEGMDLSVLMSNDWDQFRPQFIVVEASAHLDGATAPVVLFLESRGYRVCAHNVIIMNVLDEYFMMDTQPRVK